MPVLRTLDTTLLFRLTRQESWFQNEETTEATPSKGKEGRQDYQEISTSPPQFGHGTGKNPVTV